MFKRLLIPTDGSRRSAKAIKAGVPFEALVARTGARLLTWINGRSGGARSMR